MDVFERKKELVFHAAVEEARSFVDKMNYAIFTEKNGFPNLMSGWNEDLGRYSKTIIKNYRHLNQEIEKFLRSK
ncbi:MAG TPA: hypothetical protein PLS50_06780 [Candidatus Dojkabacteria bacterium]|nr:hypothetical protein [Candidatus Dojkabacteria bacterium]